MAYRLFVLVLFAAALGACAKEIGDSCATSTDCSPNGDRSCDIASPSGYCTVLGCDYSTCPTEAVCVQFFDGYFANKTCDPTVPAAMCQPDPNTGLGCCSLDELCELNGHCVARSSETRYCMRKCGSNGDCRDGYECRTFAEMITQGGQPVLAPGILVTEKTATKFCAAAPTTP